MMKKRLLVIEDEISVAKQLKWGLGSVFGQSSNSE
jgi:hypothetical protein